MVIIIILPVVVMIYTLHKAVTKTMYLLVSCSILAVSGCGSKAVTFGTSGRRVEGLLNKNNVIISRCLVFMQIRSWQIQP